MAKLSAANCSVIEDYKAIGALPFEGWRCSLGIIQSNQIGDLKKVFWIVKYLENMKTEKNRHVNNRKTPA